MKSFIKFMTKIPTKYLREVDSSISHACKVLADPDATAEEYDVIHRQLDEVQTKVGLDAVKAWRGEIAERTGVKPDAITQVIELSEKVRGFVQRSNIELLSRHLKWWWWRDALAAGLAGMVGLVIYSGMRQADSFRGGVAHLQSEAEIARLQQELARSMEIRLSDRDFRIIAASIAEPQLAQPHISEPSANQLPQNSATMPVSVTISHINRPIVEYTSSLGKVASAVPQAYREQFVSVITSASTPPNSDDSSSVGRTAGVPRPTIPSGSGSASGNGSSVAPSNNRGTWNRSVTFTSGDGSMTVRPSGLPPR